MNFTITNLSPGIYGKDKNKIFKSNIIKYHYSTTIVESVKFGDVEYINNGSSVDLASGINALITKNEVIDRFTVMFLRNVTDDIDVDYLNYKLTDGDNNRYVIGSRIVIVDNYSEYELICINPNNNYGDNIWSYKLLNII